MNLKESRNQPGSRQRLRRARRQRTKYYYRKLQLFESGLIKAKPTFCNKCAYAKCRCGEVAA